MRFAAGLLVALMCALAVSASAFAMEMVITNETPYDILGFALEGVSDDGQQISSFSAVRALPGERCGEKNGSISKLTALQVDFGRGRVAVKDCALKNKAELILRMDDEGKPILTTSDGKSLPLAYSDLRFPHDNAQAVDFVELLQAGTREKALALGGAAVQEFKSLNDIVMPVRFGETVWTGAVCFVEGGSIARIRLMTEKSSEGWKDILPDFLAAFELRPLSLTLPDGVTIRYYDKNDVSSAGSAEEARENFFMMVTDEDIQKAHHEGKLTALIGTESAFADCAESKRPVSPAMGAVLRMSASELVVLDVEKDISGIVELERMR
ncbi:MAG: hypothetical protein K6F46_02700 [Desulfovibrio sp.]|nr:hypothetical protein [Desulfovibrio sp.]